ncbi:MAG: glycosyltransferase [Coriobacteriia bacterium]|nr:glycosyltransferase [Coriobacteriia bacterium]
MSVIVTTWKEVPSIYEAVASVVNQSLSQSKIEIIIVVNGSNEQYFEKLESTYQESENVRVLYTSRLGASHACNLGVAEASMRYLTFLDDDDQLTEGYLAELLNLDEPEVSIIMGKLSDFEAGSLSRDTYINRAIQSSSKRRTSDYLSISSLFANKTAKLIRTNLMKARFLPFPEEFSHSIDVVFWCRNFGRLTGLVAVASARTKETYIRKKTSDSLSRPDSAKLMQYTDDKLAMIKEFSELYLDGNTRPSHKTFLRNVMSRQSLFLKDYTESDPSGQCLQLIQERLLADDGLLIKRSLFAQVKGLAFCQLFLPEASPSSYVSSRRLWQLSKYLGKVIDWTVLKQDLSERRHEDRAYYSGFAQYFCGNVKNVFVRKPNDFMLWGQNAFESALFYKVPYVYSRAQFPGSHVAASKYKALYPETTWFAEFSDPLSRGTDDCAKTDLRYEEIENLVYDGADCIIFTNNNQREYMLGYCGRSDTESIRERSLVWNHTVIDKAFVGSVQVNYALNEEQINVAYFGSFYMNRGHENMLRLLNNPRVVLHIFTPDYFKSNYGQIDDDIKRMGVDPGRLRRNDAVSYMEMLGLAQRMDYLYLGDVSFPGTVNPYLPSKYSDYVASGSKIIAVVEPGSPLSQQRCDQLIKLQSLNDDFIATLAKPIS